MRRDRLTVLPTDPANPVLAEFLRHHEAGIRKFFPEFRAGAADADLALLSLRDAQLAGVILGQRLGSGTLHVTLDYVAPEYRDFKVGRHVFVENAAVLRSLGFTRVAAEAPTPEHRAYLERVGFTPDPERERGWLVRKL
jgi:GNAT superfamily N-acetyltransferase